MLPHTVDRQEGSIIGGTEPAHISQGLVGEDDVGRFPYFPGYDGSQIAQLLEEFFISGADIADPGLVQAVLPHHRGGGITQGGTGVVNPAGILVVHGNSHSPPLRPLDFIVEVGSDRLRGLGAEVDHGQPAFGNIQVPIRGHLVEHVADSRLRNRGKGPVAGASVKSTPKEVLRPRPPQYLGDLS